MHVNYTSFSLEMWFVGPNSIVHKNRLFSTRAEREQLSLAAMRYFSLYPTN